MSATANPPPCATSGGNPAKPSRSAPAPPPRRIYPRIPLFEGRLRRVRHTAEALNAGPGIGPQGVSGRARLRGSDGGAPDRRGAEAAGQAARIDPGAPELRARDTQARADRPGRPART